MWNLKKGHNELLCRTDTNSQTLKNLQFPKETVRGWGDTLGVWDGNPIKLDCDDHCTTINVINSLSNKKIKKSIYAMSITKIHSLLIAKEINEQFELHFNSLV